ncbi:hypothetical protein AGMMS49546_23460 [Spirochaetia bacterium]|nr:hypothetical protein AGMMS49546_23460 [Spirochaetia bacterium]
MASPAFAPLQESAAGACAALVSFGGEFQEVAHAGEATPQPASVVNGREGAPPSFMGASFVNGEAWCDGGVAFQIFG